MAANTDEAEIRKMILHVCRRLTDSDVRKVKFLLADKLNVSALQCAKSVIDIFGLVNDRKLLTLDFLSELLLLLNRKDLASKLDAMPSSSSSSLLRLASPSRSTVLSALVRSRRLHLFRMLEEKQLNKEHLKELVFGHKLNRDLAEGEWPEVVEKLLHTNLLDDKADEAAVRDWIRKHIDDVIGESVDTDQGFFSPGGMISVVDEPDQIDSIPETAEELLTGTEEPPAGTPSFCSILPVDRQVMEASYNSDQRIGEGQSAVVYKGSCPQNWLKKYGALPVAVKVLKPGVLEEKLNKRFHDFFIQELQATHVLRSPYVLPLLGYTSCPSSDSSDSAQRSPYCALMFPFMSGNDLFHRLFGKDSQSPERVLSWRSRVQIAYQMAAGLQTMHTSVPGRRQPIVHRDIKSANVLLDELNNARLADTGLSREVLLEKSSWSTAASCGTRGYSHPAASEGPYFMQYDWFSFGIVLLELILQKPAAVPGESPLYKRLLNRWPFLHYTNHEDINNVPPLDAREMHGSAWKGGEDSRQAADHLLHVALHCIAAFSGGFDDEHRKEWLGYTCSYDRESTGKGHVSDSESCWTELTPVTLLRELCRKHKIPLYNTSEPGSSDAEHTASGRCAACLVSIPPRVGANSLHTMSAACRPGECSWYCSDCMRSGEPVHCLQHGTAQPIVGGKNAYFIAVSGAGKGAAIFERDCSRLKDVLTDCRFAGLSCDNVSIFPAPIKNEVQLRLLSLILHLEEKVLDCACSRTFDNLHPHLQCRKPLRQAIDNVCTSVRKRVALKKCCSMFLNSTKFASGLSSSQRNRLLTRLVDLAWKRVDYLKKDVKERVVQIFAMFHLWSADSRADISPEMDAPSQVRQNEAVELEKLASQFRCQTVQDNLNLKNIVDACFRELILSCCLPVSSQAVTPEELQRCLIGLIHCIGEEMLHEAGRAIVDSLRPLTDGVIWYHYCGHGTGSGDDSLDEEVLPKELLEAAGRLVANLIVTLDCCHADANVPKIAFFVDELAPYSGYSVLASCTAKQESQYAQSAAFTEFLICGLRSAADDCRLAFDRCFLGGVCADHRCRACSTYRKGDEHCQICTEYRSAGSGCRQLVDVFNYIDAHLCIGLMRPVMNSSDRGRHLPVAYAHSQPPTYSVQLLLPAADQPYDRKEHTIKMSEMPCTLTELSLRMLYEALLILKVGSSVTPETSLEFPLACKLVACDKESHTGTACIDLALQLMQSRGDMKKLYRACDSPSFHELVSWQSQVAQESVDGSVHPEGIAAVDSSECTTELDPKVASLIFFRSVVGEITSDSALQMSFRRGFPVSCTIDF